MPDPAARFERTHQQPGLGHLLLGITATVIAAKAANMLYRRLAVDPTELGLPPADGRIAGVLAARVNEYVQRPE